MMYPGPLPFDDRLMEWNIDFNGCVERSDYLTTNKCPQNENMIAWLLKAVSFIDLTSLSGDDSSANISRLVLKALTPISRDIMNILQLRDLHCAAVCVYPSQVCNVLKLLKASGKQVPIASVATGFPSGQTFFSNKIDEIKTVVLEGANEIDVVVNRQLVLEGKFKELYNEIVLMRSACCEAKLKVILAVGELGSFSNIYNASITAMLAGADFIKTSTGKEGVNATYPVGIIMMRAIRNFYHITGRKVGFKPAGGIKNCQDALNWCLLVREELGNDWLDPSLFRIGASSLLSDIESQIYYQVTGKFGTSVNFSVV